MSVVRRAFAALSGLFLLQLMLVGSGTLCVMQHGAQQPGESGHVMRMAGMPQQTSSHQSTVSGVDDGNVPMSPANGSGDHDGCRVPLAPGQCGSMSTCSISAAPTKITATSVLVQTLALALPDPTQGQSGPTFAPELPPPRA